MSTTEINNLAINTIRTLCIDTIDKANSGHPGLPMGAAPMAYALWQNHLRHNPSNPQWPNRDRFVLSAGHGSTLLYSLLHLTGYELGLDDLKNFRQWESKTPGHPEFGHTAGVEATTGPLGQGAANAVGMAMAERAMASLYNREGYELFDHQTYALVGDGDLMEGVAYEAVSLAGTLGLGKLTYLYDSNDITLDGPAELTFTEDVAARFEASGWHVQTVKDGDTDIDAINTAIENAKAESGKPSLIIVRTTIGYGSPNRQGTSGIHGSPLGSEERALAKKELGWDFADDFHVPAEVAKHMGAAKEKGKGCQKEWGDKLAAYGEAHPELAKELALALAGKLPEGWKDKLPKFEVSDQLATRQSGGKVVNAIAQAVPNFFGGDADLSVSTGTGLKGEENFNGQSGAGRNIRYGIREHAMGAIANGIAYHGGLRSFISTFFVFTDYLRPALRLAAMSKLPVIGVFTHDSIGLG
ncbi:transketolase, partial [Myxococcota bacterium]|nr:transketolase [Myxococcota bacterium]